MHRPHPVGARFAGQRRERVVPRSCAVTVQRVGALEPVHGDDQFHRRVLLSLAAGPVHRPALDQDVGAAKRDRRRHIGHFRVIPRLRQRHRPCALQPADLHVVFACHMVVQPVDLQPQHHRARDIGRDRQQDVRRGKTLPRRNARHGLAVGHCQHQIAQRLLRGLVRIDHSVGVFQLHPHFRRSPSALRQHHFHFFARGVVQREPHLAFRAPDQFVVQHLRHQHPRPHLDHVGRGQHRQFAGVGRQFHPVAHHHPGAQVGITAHHHGHGRLRSGLQVEWCRHMVHAQESGVEFRARHRRGPRVRHRVFQPVHHAPQDHRVRRQAQGEIRQDEGAPHALGLHAPLRIHRRNRVPAAAARIAGIHMLRRRGAQFPVQQAFRAGRPRIQIVTRDPRYLRMAPGHHRQRPPGLAHLQAVYRQQRQVGVCPGGHRRTVPRRIHRHHPVIGRTGHRIRIRPSSRDNVSCPRCQPRSIVKVAAIAVDGILHGLALRRLPDGLDPGAQQTQRQTCWRGGRRRIRRHHHRGTHRPRRNLPVCLPDAGHRVPVRPLAGGLGMVRDAPAACNEIHVVAGGAFEDRIVRRAGHGLPVQHDLPRRQGPPRQPFRRRQRRQPALIHFVPAFRGDGPARVAQRVQSLITELQVFRRLARIRRQADGSPP